ncbi:MAG: glycosyltransferase family 4 protein [Bdellovibrionaceae bacterium]|nr:glycosyltransferase family 4 protein [Pseudobdellovibrionaceae bacterium]MDW8190462.1 glycosyltransferase family 4 protein [Pseudobdellovibrionaceae bacterium]
MRVLFAVSDFTKLIRTKEYERYWPILKELSSLGIDVDVCAPWSPSGREEEVKDGVHFFFLCQNQRGGTYQFFYQLSQFVINAHRDFPISIIHFLDPFPAYQMSILKKKVGTRFIFDVTLLSISELFYLFNKSSESLRNQIQIALKTAYLFAINYFSRDRDFLRVADGIFVYSPDERFFLERYYFYPDSRIFFSYRTAIIKEPSSDTKPLPAILGASPVLTDAPSIFLLFSEMKSQDETVQVLRAFERVVIKRRNTFLYIIGSGPSYRRVEYELLSLALGNYAFMLGELTTEEISRWIQMADVVIDLNPTLRQGEVYLIEAMLRRKLVIASELGGWAHIIDNGVDGFLVRPADVESLSQLMLRLLQNREMWGEIQNKAYEKATQVFNPGKAVDFLVKAYQTVLEREVRL